MKTLWALLVLLMFLPVAAETPALPETPLAAAGLLYARPFALEQPMEYRWSADRPMVTSGWILVLEVDPAVAWPRQTALPVLYAGGQVGRYAMKGYPAGTVVALVPGALDLFAEPVWFGTPRLPEQVDGAVVLAERLLADQTGIGPFPGPAVEAALAAGGGPLHIRSAVELESVALDLHRRYVEPQEN